MRVKALKEVYGTREIDARIRALAAEINADYTGNDAVVLLCVLKGAFMFFSDLIKHLDFSPQIDFIQLSSYGDGDASSGVVRGGLSTGLSLSGKDVLVVEDIVDSGRSMHFLQGLLLEQGVNTLRIAALVDKLERREVDVAVNYAGFSVPSGFLVGYGLDYAERFRELPALYVVELDR